MVNIEEGAAFRGTSTGQLYDALFSWFVPFLNLDHNIKLIFMLLHMLI